MTTRFVSLSLLVVLTVVAAGPAAAIPATADDLGVTDVQNETNDTEADLGASISAFMQASAADAEGDVEDGMFTARFQNASNENRQRIVRSRTGTLHDRLDALREQRSALLNASGNLSIAERAKASRLTAQVESLRSAINTTSEAADRAGVDADALRELSENASTLGGPEVAALATGLVDGDGRPGAAVGAGGPPEDPGSENGDANRSDEGQENAADPSQSAERRDDRANATSDPGENGENGASSESGDSEDGDVRPGNASRGGGAGDPAAGASEV